MANEEDINDDIDTILRYCGFAGANDRISDLSGANGRISIDQDGFKSFEDIMSQSEKGVSSLEKELQKGPLPAGRSYPACAERIS
jgi:hypothetical protein